ncbi:MAG: hypothetical protein WCB95_07040 [Aeromicrobium sp.]
MKLTRCCLLALAAVMLSAAPAHAADEISLSRDGITWYESLPDTLFSESMRWVPGDSQIETFYVRNDGPGGALFTITARRAGSPELVSNDDIALRARVDGGSWVSLINGMPSENMTKQNIKRGDVARVDVNATFDPASSNQTQRTTLAAVFTVALAGTPERNESAGGSGDVGRGALLPGVGSRVSAWLLVAASAMLALGVRFVRRLHEVHHG